MKTLVKLLLMVVFSILATTPQAVANSLSPFGVNASLDPSQGTAAAADIFQDISTLGTMETNASEMVAPAWLEILVLVSPANFPISTFLTQKVLDGVRGLAKAQMINGSGDDVLIKTDKGESRFNTKYAVDQKYMTNADQFGDTEIKNYKLNWGEIAVIPFQDKVNASFSAPSAVRGSLVVANIAMWTHHSLLKVQGASYANGDDLILFVEAVTPGTSTLTVRSTGGATGGENIPAITDQTRITRMGPAFPELGVKNTAVMQSPTSDYNYAQKFITSVVWSNWLMLTNLFTNYSFSMVTNLALQDFRYGQEFAFMFGNRSKFTANVIGGGTETVMTTGGLTYYIDQEIEYGTGGGDTTINETNIVDFTRQMRVGNNGSDTRYLFAGSNLISALNKGVMNDSTRFVQKDYDTVYGLSFTVLYSFFGTINVMYAPLMDQTEYIDRGFLLDMQFVDKFVFQPFKETTTDLLKLRESDAKSVDMMETCGLVCRNNDTHSVFVVKS